MTAYNTKSEDDKGRQIKPILFNTDKDGSGTFYLPYVDSDGRLQVGNSDLGTLADAAAAGDVTATDTLIAYVKQLVNYFHLVDADLSSVKDDSVIAKIFAEDGDVSAFDDNKHSLEAIRNKVDAVQGGAETLESLGDELDAELDFAEVQTIASPVTLTGSYQYIYSQAPGRVNYFAGVVFSWDSGGWAGGETVDIVIETKTDGTNWAVRWQAVQLAAAAVPVEFAVPHSAAGNLTGGIQTGFYTNGSGVRVGIKQNAEGGAYHVVSHSPIDGQPGS